MRSRQRRQEQRQSRIDRLQQSQPIDNNLQQAARIVRYIYNQHILETV